MARNVQMYVYWAAGNVDRMRTFAKELVHLQAEVILAHNSPATAALQRETQTIPIVFVIVSDPVGQGFVVTLARPGGNITGFVFIEATMGGKWLELLAEIAPRVRRVAAMSNPDTAPSRGSYVLPSFEEAARSLKVEAITAPVHSDAEIETVLTRISHTIFSRWSDYGSDLLPFQTLVRRLGAGRRGRGLGFFARLRWQRRRDPGGPLDDAAVVARCGDTCQAGEPRALAAALRRMAAQPQTWAAGQLDAIAILIRRTLTRTSAPILSSLRRMVPQVALANGV
jgi:hypothetical protein